MSELDKQKEYFNSNEFKDLWKLNDLTKTEHILIGLCRIIYALSIAFSCILFLYMSPLPTICNLLIVALGLNIIIYQTPILNFQYRRRIQLTEKKYNRNYNITIDQAKRKSLNQIEKYFSSANFYLTNILNTNLENHNSSSLIKLLEETKKNINSRIEFSDSTINKTKYYDLKTYKSKTSFKLDLVENKIESLIEKAHNREEVLRHQENIRIRRKEIADQNKKHEAYINKRKKELIEWNNTLIDKERKWKSTQDKLVISSYNKQEFDLIHQKKIKVDWSKINQLRLQIGEVGEFIVLEHERNKLKKLFPNTNKIPIQTSKINDAAGYDIRSFDNEGNVIFIEVKSTTNKNSQSAYLSTNELLFLQKNVSKYFIYRLSKLNIESKTADLAIYSGEDILNNHELIVSNYKIIFKK